MSLVGSLEDLGLGDILQIVSLSRKSGLLMIHSDEGEGRIVFCDGLVRAAYVKGEANDLRDLLVTTGFVDGDEFDRAGELAAARGESLDVVIPECTGLTKERLDSLRREHIERSVFRIFSWQGGEFSFEVRDEVESRDAEILVSMGINAQYLTMEATRIGDEDDRSGIDGEIDEENPRSAQADMADDASPDTEPFFSGETVEGPSFESVNEPLSAPMEEPAAFIEEPSALIEEPSAFIDEPTAEAIEESLSAPIGEPMPARHNVEPAAEPIVESNTDPFADPSLDERESLDRDGHATNAAAADTEDVSGTPEPHALEGADGASALEVVALAAARREGHDEAASSTEVEKRDGAPEKSARSAAKPVCLIVIDPELAVLEWQKATLKDLFARVHIFQRGEAGISRIRQYLGRGDVPIVLVSSELPEDSKVDSSDIGQFVQRLKQHAPSMPVLVSWVEGEDDISVPTADAMIRRPNAAFVGNRRSAKILDDAAATLRTDMCEWLDRARQPKTQVRVRVAPEKPVAREESEAPAAGLQRLRETSQRMRDPDTRGEALSLVLEFAADSFSRVAIFMVRDETAVGIAQSGLPSAGGPGDDDFCGIEIPAGRVEWFAHVIERRCAISRAPGGEGDRELVARLGNESPTEAYVAPIESGDRVVALLYADNLPKGGSVPDTTILELVLHEAGLALERALLERALASAEGDDAGS